METPTVRAADGNPPPGRRAYTREPLIHSHVTDVLPDDDERAFNGVHCAKCQTVLHAANNECMRTWIDTEHGAFCTTCWGLTEVLEALDENLATGKLLAQLIETAAGASDGKRRWLVETVMPTGTTPHVKNDTVTDTVEAAGMRVTDRGDLIFLSGEPLPPGDRNTPGVAICDHQTAFAAGFWSQTQPEGQDDRSEEIGLLRRVVAKMIRHIGGHVDPPPPGQENSTHVGLQVDPEMPTEDAP